MTQKMEKAVLKINNARIAERVAINDSAKKYVSKNVAECKKVARELKQADATYTKANAAFTKKQTDTNKQVLAMAKAHLEECIVGYNTIVGNITSTLNNNIKHNFDAIYESMKAVDALKASYHADDYAKYSEQIEKEMNAIAKSLRSCKSIQK